MPAIEVEELAVEELSQLAARLAAAVREAGALALSLFQTPLKNWTKGPTASPVCEADIAVNNLLRERLTAAPGADGAPRTWISPGCRRKAPTIRGGLPHAMSGSSIRSTAPAPIWRGWRIGRCRRRWSRTAGRSSPAFTRRSRDDFFMARAKAGATRNGAAIAATNGGRARGRAHRRAEKPAGTVCRGGAAVFDRAAGALAGAAACRRRARRLATSPLPAATATTGTLRRPIFWCTKRAAHFRPLRAEP